MKREITSASKLAMRFACKASHRIEAAVIAEAEASGKAIEDESEVSAMGTLGHTHFADKTLDRSALGKDLQWALRIADEEEANFYAAVEAREGLAGEEYEQGYERELWLRDNSGVRLFPGHCDGWRYWPTQRVLAIPDLKLGYIRVDGADSNWQIASYGCMGRQLTECAVFYGAIIQPRLPLGERLTVGRYDATELDAAMVEIENLFASLDSASEPVSGPHCRYCKGKLVCPAYQAQLTVPARIVSGELTRKTAPAALATLRHEQLSQIGDAIKFAGMIEDAWKTEVKARIEAEAMPGYTLKPGAKKRTITDPIRAFELLSDATGVTDREFMDACTPSREKLTGPVAKRMSVSLGKAALLVDEALHPVLVESQNAPSIVKI